MHKIIYNYYYKTYLKSKINTILNYFISEFYENNIPLMDPWALERTPLGPG